MNLEILDSKGLKTESVEINSEIFGIEPNNHAIYLDVKWHLANKRQGTHFARGKSEVNGSTRKLYKQKGTGNARKGSSKSPVLSSGGTAFGPRNNRDYKFKLNKKVRKLARVSALSYKMTKSEILGIENILFETPKTKYFLKVMQDLSISNEKILLLLAQKDKNVFLSARNIENVKVKLANDITSYDILKANKVLITKDALEVLNNNYLN